MPLLCQADDLDRIAKQANATECALATSILTRDVGIAQTLAQNLTTTSMMARCRSVDKLSD